MNKTIRFKRNYSEFKTIISILIIILMWSLFALVSSILTDDKLYTFLLGVISAVCVALAFRISELIVDKKKINFRQTLKNIKVLIDRDRSKVIINYIIMIAVLIGLFYLIDILNEMYPGDDPDSSSSGFSHGSLFGIIFYSITWWWISRSRKLYKEGIEQQDH